LAEVRRIIKHTRPGAALHVAIQHTNFKEAKVHPYETGAVRLNETTGRACCEVSGFVYASTLVLRVDVPLALVRKAHKLLPPHRFCRQGPSHILSSKSNDLRDKRIEVERDVVLGARASGGGRCACHRETLCAVLQLLDEVGIGAGDVSIMNVTEFPVRRGREMLHRRGFGRDESSRPWCLGFTDPAPISPVFSFSRPPLLPSDSLNSSDCEVKARDRLLAGEMEETRGEMEEVLEDTRRDVEDIERYQRRHEVKVR